MSDFLTVNKSYNLLAVEPNSTLQLMTTILDKDKLVYYSFMYSDILKID